MRVLVTGGAGYIGSHTVKALIEAKHEPIILDNLIYGHKDIVKDVLKVPLCVGQVGDQDLLRSILLGTHENLKGTIHEKKHIEAVLHFAAYAYVGESVKDPIKYYKNNVSETITLLDNLCDEEIIAKRLDKSPIPLVFSSTCATYGIPNSLPITENTPQLPINPYGKSKLMIEEIIKDLGISKNLRSVVLRYSNAAGASPDSLLGEDHDPETHLIPLIITSVLEKNKNWRVFGNDYETKDGTCIRDYIHVCDLADAHVLALKILEENNKKIFKNENCKFFNVGTGKGVSVLDVIKFTEEICGEKIYFIFDKRREGDPSILVASAKKVMRELKWKPKFPEVKDIILHAYNWHKKRSNKND